MNKILLIDYSTIATRIWYAMRTKGYIAKTDSEASEFARGLAQAAMIIKERFSDHLIMICADSRPGCKTWRVDAWKSFYRKEILQKSFGTLERLYAYLDGFYYEISYHPETKTYGNPRKLTKGELAEVKATEQWVPSVFPKIHEKALLDFLPGYKGSRKDSRWLFTTPKDVYKEWRHASAPRFAALVGGGYACVDGAEADDIIGLAIRHAPPDAEITVMSTDQDIAWSEDKGVGQFSDKVWICTTYDSPVLRKPIKDQQAVIDNLTYKVLIGDPGDDIGPCILKSGERVTGVPAKSLVKKGEALLEEIEIDTWERNWSLISLLEESPLEDSILEKLSDPFAEVIESTSNWGMTDTEWHIARGQGRSLHLSDSKKENWV